MATAAPTGTTRAGATPPDAEEVPLECVEEELCTLAGQIAAATCRFLALLADFDARGGWAGVGIRSCAHWLSWRCGLDLRTAREHVRVARALRSLPRTAEAFAAGRISYSKARAIARVASPTSDADLVEAALHSPASHLERLTRGLAVAGAAPEQLDETSHVAGVPALPWAREPEDDPYRSRLRVHHSRDDDGSLVIWGRLSAEDGALLLAAATRADAARRLTAVAPDEDPSAAGPHRGPAPETLVARAPSDLAPALVAMAATTMTSVDAPVHAPAADVVVHVDARAGTGRLDDGPGLPRPVVERLMCDARLQVSVDGPDGTTLDLGRRRRRPTTRQVGALWRRDRGCVVPGCGRVRFLHAHHVVPWSRGGPTSVDNLVLLCGDHHRSLHDGRLGVVPLGRQRFRVVDADGVEVLPAPAVRGDAGQLVRDHADVTPRTIEPLWNGEPLDLPWATAVYLSAWAS